MTTDFLTWHSHADKRTRIALCHFFLLVIPLLFPALRVLAAPGDLDPTFGTGGVTAPFASYPFSLAYSPGDGAILTASGGTVRRYTSAGSLDVSFGTSGETTIPQIRPHTGSTAPEQIVVDGAGRILVGGPINPTSDDLVVARLNNDGSIDSLFGTSGATTVDLKSTADIENISSLALQSDGKILVSGHYLIGTPLEEAGVIVRLTAGGALDGTFGSGGKVVLPNADHDPVIAVQSDDKIVVAVSHLEGSGVEGAFHLNVSRLTSNGAADSGFAAGGTTEVTAAVAPVVFPRVTNTFALNVFVQSDGKIVVAGVVYSSKFPSDINEVFVLGRILSDGTLDASYGSDGVVALPTFGSTHRIAALGPDDTVFIGPTNDFVARSGVGLRIRSNGAPEPGFGNCGAAWPSYVGEQISVVVQADGNYVLGMEQTPFSSYTLARIEGGASDVSAEPDADGDGISDTCDLCPADPDATQPNRDGDLFGDACDPCTGLSERLPLKASIKVKGLAAPTGDEKLAIKGTLAVPPSPAIDPLTTGVRIIVGDSPAPGNYANLYLDVMVPADAYDSVTKTGWKEKNGKFQYKNPSGLAGIKKVKITPDSNSPGIVKVKVVGKNVTLPASLGTGVAAFVQLRGSQSFQCGRWDAWLAAGECEVVADQVTCKRGN